MKKILRYCRRVFEQTINHIRLKRNNVEVGNNLTTNGLIFISHQGDMKIGSNVILNSRKTTNPSAGGNICAFTVCGGGYCELGDNVAASHISLTCWNQIIIGKDVLIGSNTIITDSDFHSLDSEYRANERNKNYDERKEHIHTAPVHIGEGAFIGARCIILKGVSIGSKSIVGAGSVVLLRPDFIDDR